MEKEPAINITSSQEIEERDLLHSKPVEVKNTNASVVGALSSSSAAQCSIQSTCTIEIGNDVCGISSEEPLSTTENETLSKVSLINPDTVSNEETSLASIPKALEESSLESESSSSVIESGSSSTSTENLSSTDLNDCDGKVSSIAHAVPCISFEKSHASSFQAVKSRKPLKEDHITKDQENADLAFVVHKVEEHVNTPEVTNSHFQPVCPRARSFPGFTTVNMLKQRGLLGSSECKSSMTGINQKLESISWKNNTDLFFETLFREISKNTIEFQRLKMKWNQDNYSFKNYSTETECAKTVIGFIPSLKKKPSIWKRLNFLLPARFAKEPLEKEIKQLLHGQFKLPIPGPDDYEQKVMEMDPVEREEILFFTKTILSMADLHVEHLFYISHAEDSLNPNSEYSQRTKEWKECRNAFLNLNSSLKLNDKTVLYYETRAFKVTRIYLYRQLLIRTNQAYENSFKFRNEFNRKYNKEIMHLESVK